MNSDTIKRINEREIALNILLKVLEEGQFSHLVLREVLASYQDLEKRQRAFINNLVQGSIQHKLELDYIINQFSKIPTSKMKPLIRNLMRLSVYQMKYMDQVPDSAICNEAVKLASKRGYSSLRGFVNGVLRSILRGLHDIEYPSDPIEAFEVLYSIPKWMLELWSESYELEIVRKICEAVNQSTTFTIRTNTELVSPEVLFESLRSQGFQVSPHPYLPYACYLSGVDYLDAIADFRRGEFYVQDISSMLVTEIADVKPGYSCVDVCAAPGGKSLHLASKLKGTGTVLARDLTEFKVRLINENRIKSGLTNIKTQVWDARVYDESLHQQMDLVLADLPCSGLGIIGKKPDLRYNASKEGIESLVKLQREILTVVKDYVKPGGVLLYSTCTIHPSENEEQVRWFLQSFPEFSLDDITSYLPPQLQEDVRDFGMLQLLPGVHETDGFFLCRLKRSNTDHT